MPPENLGQQPLSLQIYPPAFPGNNIPEKAGFNLAMSHTIFTILADAAAAPAAAAPQQPFNPTLIIYVICFGAIFYFLTIRPQSLKQKEMDALLKSVKTGDKIVTLAGIHGMVSNVKDATLIVKVADNVKIEIDKSSVGRIVKRDDAEPASA
jgi:preprotein translocase subunit YajC